ncbi:ribonuclease III [Halomonas denitrificans]
MSKSSTSPARVVSLPGLPYVFGDPALLEQALTHRSHGYRHNERLEFLGDALLNFTIAALLFEERPDAPEGDLSRMRARLVRDRTLAQVARELGLGDHLRLGPGELKSGGYLRESILADALEAIFGAALLDGGVDRARQLVEALLRPRLDALPDVDMLKDPKTRLQEFLQARGLNLPEYRVIEERGADHAREFTVSCTVDVLDAPVQATAGSRRKAEQAAARAVLERIEAEQQR